MPTFILSVAASPRHGFRLPATTRALRRCGVCLGLAFWAATSSLAQGPAVTPVPAGSPPLADPYQRVQTASFATNPLAVVNAASEAVVAPQPFPSDDPYANPGPQLNAPVLEAPPPMPTPPAEARALQPLLSPSDALLGPFQPFDPLLPTLGNRLDSRIYLRTEYLLWDVSGMDTPPLVTSSPSGTAINQAGVPGQPGTSVLFGNDELNDSTADGLLFQGGLWVTPMRRVAIEGEYVHLDDQTSSFRRSAAEQAVLGRPYVDVLQGLERARLVAYPGRRDGAIEVAAASEFRSYLINARMALLAPEDVACRRCSLDDRVDWIVGYRNLRLSDSLSIGEHSEIGDQQPATTTAVGEHVRTTNQFHGLQLGVIHRVSRRYLWLESALRVAAGNQEQQLRIAGTTTRTVQGVVTDSAAGLLALSSNSGRRTRDEFVLVPEIGVRLGLRLTERLHATLGYTALYLPNVIRAGEQIDRDLNPGLIPPGASPVSGVLRPRPLWVQTDYLAHGVHFGGEFRF